MVAEVEEGAHEHHHKGERHVDGNNRQRKEQCGAHHGNACPKDAPGVDGLLAEDVNHPDAEQPNDCHDREVTHGGERALKGDFSVADADYEIEHGGKGGEEKGAGHAFAVEDQEEGGVDQCTPRFLLHNDKPHGEQHEQGGLEQVAHLVEREPVLPTHLCYRQCRDAFGELGRLQIDRSERNPGARALNVLCDEGRDEQEHHRQDVQKSRKLVEILVVDEQNDQSDNECQAHPHNLLSGASGKVEEVGIAYFMAGPADGKPPEDHQEQVYHDHHPIC